MDPIEAKVICICASFRFAQQMNETRKALESRGAKCLMPSKDADVSRGVQSCFRRIDAAGAVLVVNPGGYIGTSVLLDIGYAWAKQKPICLTANHDDPAVMSLATSVVDLEQ